MAARGARLGFLGPAGTFSEEAARAYLERVGDPRRPVPYPEIPELLAAVEEGGVELAIVPVENSIEGSVAVTVDMLVHEVDLRICGEVVIPVRHNLLAPPGLTLDRVEEVLSHPQALAQCRRSLARLLPGVPCRPASSTADAARQATGSRAALGTGLAARLYGLQVLAHDLQDVADNATRFLVVGRQDAPPTGRDKTSAVFGFHSDRPGTLYQALGEFASRGVNLTRLESRPTRKVLGEYLFLVDMEGHRDDAPLREALGALRKRCAFFKLLGSYPRAPELVQGTGSGSGPQLTKAR